MEHISTIYKKFRGQLTKEPQVFEHRGWLFAFGEAVEQLLFIAPAHKVGKTCGVKYAKWNIAFAPSFKAHRVLVHDKPLSHKEWGLLILAGVLFALLLILAIFA